MTTFTQARAAAAEAFGRTLDDGYEDATDFCVTLAEPLSDGVVMVSKANGRARAEVYFDVQDKLDMMLPVGSTSPADGV